MLVINAAMWPSGDAQAAGAIGRIAIGRVGASVGGDYADYLVVYTNGNGDPTRALLLRRRHVMAGWQDLLWAALDGEGSEQVPVDDPRVITVVAKLKRGASPQV